MEQKKLLSLFVIVSIFAVAMGLLESAVVIYIREVYYPSGFNFPLVPIKSNIATTELFRELATVIMLLIIGYLAGRNLASRFAWFLYAFAIWDIFYYVFLKVFANWPESLMTDDLLFLIPVVWVGPVITPVIVSLSMILLASIILVYDSKGIKTRLNRTDWILLFAGSVILILSFSWDYGQYIIERYGFSKLWVLPGSSLFEMQMDYVPVKFNWLLFLAGQSLIFYRIFWFWRRLRLEKPV